MSLNEPLAGGGPKVPGQAGSSVSSRLRRVVVITALVCSVLVPPCCGQNNPLSCGKRQGIPSEDSNFVAPRIARGREAERGDWPWHAAIYLPIGNKPKYECGGSILNGNTILSSAHCFVAFNHIVHEEHITVHVGQIDLNDTVHGVQKFNASELIIHPNFLIRSNVQYDIAIVKLSTDIVMSPFIYPVCLWDMDDDHRELVGKTGTIVGFGMDENDQMSRFLQEAELTVVDVYECLDNDRETYGRVLTRNMYCAGSKPGVSACNGDSGGGMFFEKDGTWYLRGIISFIANRPNADLCDSSKYTVFTDVSKYRAWIRQFISDSPKARRPTHIEQCQDVNVTQQDTMCNVANRFDHGFLLVGISNEIIRVSLNGGQSFSMPAADGVDRLIPDCAEGRFYWSDGYKRIYSAKYDGTDQKAFITKDVIEPRDVAVDWISRRLYWADWWKQTIEVASLKNADERTVLISEKLGNPTAIAVDPLKRKLYWFHNYDDKWKIEWSNLDGTERQVLVSYPQVEYARSIRVLIATGELCYADDSLKKIECIDPFSKQVRSINSYPIDPRSLAVTDELVYWTDWEMNAINSITQNGVHQKPIISPDFDFRNARGITVVTNKCPVVYSPCAINNGDCPVNTICLVNPSAREGKSCLIKRKCRDIVDCSVLIQDN